MPTQQLLSFFAEIGAPEAGAESLSDVLRVDVGSNPSASTAGAACWVITMSSPMSSTWIATNAHTFHVYHRRTPIPFTFTTMA
jgi:hypothetical protein